MGLPTVIESGLNPVDAIAYVGMSRDEFFKQREARRQRLGQYWFNKLHAEDKRKLRASSYDPFYSDSWGDVLNALIFLLEN